MSGEPRHEDVDGPPRAGSSEVTRGRSGVTRRLLDAAVRLRRRLARRPSPRAQAVALLLALALFVGGGVTAWNRLELSVAELSFPPLGVLLLVLVPATIVVNAAELAVTGRVLGVRFAPSLLLRTVVVATAANFLPIPGAALVRVQALRTAGARLGAATSVTVVTAVLWVSASASVAGAALLAVGHLGPALGFLAVGVVLGLVGVGAVARQGDRVLTTPRALAEILLVEVALIVVSALRMLTVLATVGIGADLVQTLVLTVSGALAATAGVFPGGLGLTELISAALAPLVALPAAAGFTATALNRLAGVVITAPLAAVLGVDLLRRAADLEGRLDEEPAAGS